MFRSFGRGESDCRCPALLGGMRDKGMSEKRVWHIFLFWCAKRKTVKMRRQLRTETLGFSLRYCTFVQLQLRRQSHLWHGREHHHTDNAARSQSMLAEGERGRKEGRAAVYALRGNVNTEDLYCRFDAHPRRSIDEAAMLRKKRSTCHLRRFVVAGA